MKTPKKETDKKASAPETRYVRLSEFDRDETLVKASERESALRWKLDELRNAAEEFVKEYAHYVNVDDAELPDCYGLEQAIKNAKAK